MGGRTSCIAKYDNVLAQIACKHGKTSLADCYEQDGNPLTCKYSKSAKAGKQSTKTTVERWTIVLLIVLILIMVAYLAWSFYRGTSLLSSASETLKNNPQLLGLLA